jgi:hypothetical protein
MAEGDGRIGLPELLVGVPFPTAALEVVRFAVPREKLQSLIYTGRSLSARDALGAGLVDEVVSADALRARAQEVAQQLALIPPPVYRLTKQSLRAEALERIEQAGEQPDRAAQEVWSAADDAIVRAKASNTARVGLINRSVGRLPCARRSDQPVVRRDVAGGRIQPRSRLPPCVRAPPHESGTWATDPTGRQAGCGDPGGYADCEAAKQCYWFMARWCFAILPGETGSASEGARSVFRKSMSAVRSSAGSLKYATVTASASP